MRHPTSPNSEILMCIDKKRLQIFKNFVSDLVFGKTYLSFGSFFDDHFSPVKKAVE